jgi:hypothetical protein
MSHKATGWLTDVTDVTPSEFRILFILCDCHNPSKGCFPSQGYLQTKSGMSNGSINNQLNSLEDKGLIERKRRIDPTTKQRMSTVYILGFDIAKPTPDIGEGAISNPNPKPSPKNGQSQLQLLETNYVNESGKEPVRKSARSIVRDILCNVAGSEAVDGFLEMRKVIKAPMTEHAAKLISAKLQGRMNADDILNLSTENSWKGVFPESNQLNGGHNGQRTNNGQSRGDTQLNEAVERAIRIGSLPEASEPDIF